MFRLLARSVPGIWVAEAVLRALWELLVEDVQLAVGTVVSLLLALALGISGGPVRAYAGWVLLVLLVALVLVNLYGAGRRAQEHLS